MKNPATHILRDQLNPFTEVIAWRWNEYSAKTFVRLRDGTIAQPIFKPAEDDTCTDAFFAEDYSYCWNLDGTSVTRSDYDMMEIIGYE